MHGRVEIRPLEGTDRNIRDRSVGPGLSRIYLGLILTIGVAVSKAEDTFSEIAARPVMPTLRSCLNLLGVGLGSWFCLGNRCWGCDG